MRRSLIAAVCASCCWSASGRAGIYSTAEVQPGPDPTATGARPMPLELFRSVLGDRSGLQRDPALLQPGDPPLSATILERRKAYLDKAEALRTKVRSGSATVEDQVNLSAYLIWLGQYREAIELLEPLARGEQRGHFMVLSNLATAYQLSGQTERVADYLQQARDAWPAEWPGLTREQLQWFRQVDKAQYRLALLRRAEAARQPAGARRAAEHVDALFGAIDAPVRFVGDSGNFEAGKIAVKEREKLKDALPIVQQLVLWLPDDTRLYWLMGEVLNAEGQAVEAYTVLDQCVYARHYDAAELKEHRRVLQEALPPPPPAVEKPSWLPDTQKLVVVGGAACIVIALLGYFQFREYRRRRG